MTCYDKAVSLLAAREHTEKELRSKLQARGYGREEISEAAGRLLREGYLSEERFAESFIRSRLRRSPEGRSLLMMRLMEKGSPRAVASVAVSSAWDDGLYIEPLRRYASALSARKGREGAAAALLRKGFTPAEIDAALEAAADEAEGLDIE